MVLKFSPFESQPCTEFKRNRIVRISSNLNVTDGQNNSIVLNRALCSDNKYHWINGTNLAAHLLHAHKACKLLPSTTEKIYMSRVQENSVELWTDLDKIFRVNRLFTSLRMIRFWAHPPSSGPIVMQQIF